MQAILSKLHPLLTPKRKRYPFFIGAALWLGWVINLALGSGNMDATGHLIGTDFVAFYTAGKILQAGASERLYDLELARQIQQPLYGSPVELFNPYLNPPFYAVLFIPFASLPYPWSPLVWMSINLGLLWLSAKWLSPRQPGRFFWLALTWQPAFAAISFGQNAFLSLALLSLVYLLLKKDRQYAAGLTAGLLLYKPQLLFGLGVLWILDWRKNGRIFAGMATTAAALLGGSWLWMPEATRAYFSYAQKIAANLMNVPGFPIWNAHSVQSFWLGLFPGQVSLAAGLHLLCALAGIGLFLAHWRGLRQDLALGYGAALCLTIWITPYVMVYDWTILLIPALLFWHHRPEARPYLESAFAVMWAGMFLSSALTFAQWTLFGRALQISIPIYALTLPALLKVLRAPAPPREPAPIAG